MDKNINIVEEVEIDENEEIEDDRNDNEEDKMNLQLKRFERRRILLLLKDLLFLRKERLMHLYQRVVQEPFLQEDNL